MTVVVAATMSMVVAACGGDDDGDDGAAADENGAAEAEDDGEPAEPVQLRFQSLAWQEQSVAANRDLVDQWNEANPNIQVEYVQGDWGSVHDQLLTSFEGGGPPDIIHYDASSIQVFAEGGYLADLDPLLSDEFKAGISEDIWGTVQYDEFGTIGVPFLVESRLPIANRTLLEEAGIEVPTPDDPWTWDEFADAAAQLTDDDTYGVAFPLASPANAMVTLAQSFGGTFVQEGPAIEVGEAELEVPRRIHEMLYADESAAPQVVASSTTDSLPGFFAGEYAMVFGAIWLRQQMVEQAPDDFEWVTIPPLVGSEGQTQSANPQILSVAIDSEHPEEAAQFIEFFLNGENMAELALGDWLVPTSESALAELESVTGGEQGWDVAIASADTLADAPWRRTAGFQEWLDRFATPGFQRYFADEITEDDLATELEQGGEETLGR